MDEDEIVETMLGYLAERPHVRGTVEGIAVWWLKRSNDRSRERRTVDARTPPAGGEWSVGGDRDK